MSSVGIVVTGDNHLSAYLPRLSPQRRAERRERLRAGFTAAVDYAIAERARLFVQAGDLFDTPSPSNQDRAFVAASLARLRAAGIICAGIGGNHDTPRMLTEQGGDAPQHIYAALGGMHYFVRNDALVPVLLELDGLRLALAGLSNNPVAPPGSDPLATVVIEDSGAVLNQADVGLLVIHAGMEGLCQPNEGERIVTRASIAALPPVFRAIVGGHIHRFGRAREGERALVVCGATERMEFGAPPGGSGFAWLEIDREGVRRVEHIRVDEQPRADLMISTGTLWPDGSRSGYGKQPSVPDALELPAADVQLWPDQMRSDRIEEARQPVAAIRRALDDACTPETLVRLRLSGPLTLEQYHTLALREVVSYGQQRAFSFDLDTSGLVVTETALRSDEERRDGAGPLAPAQVVEQILAEQGRSPAGTAYTHEEWRAAGDLLLARLRESVDREAGR
ncbi:MAG: metallophosphoesterase family protein [Ktedonobacterales bacterium]